MPERQHAKHHYHSPWKRGFYSLTLVVFVLATGTLGIHFFEKLSYLDSFYFMSMIATGQGPNIMPITTGGKVFISIMAFISMGSVVASLGFLFGPFLGKLWKVGVEKFEEELRHGEKK